jgi:hypothetical protein
MDACIEGLPRSANTFGTIAFVARNPTAEIAHHVHLPMQFQRAVDLGVPCVVLIREPVGNLTSLVIAGENDLSHDLAFRVYIHYYRRIAELRDRLSLCDFGEVSSDPSVIARRLNERFGTTFDAEPMGTEEQQGIRSLIEDAQEETHLRPAHGTVPSEFKERLKPALRAELEKHPLLPTARALYDELSSSIQP